MNTSQARFLAAGRAAGSAAQARALPGELWLRDGTAALIWPLLPFDAETLRDMFRRMSAESRKPGGC